MARRGLPASRPGLRLARLRRPGSDHQYGYSVGGTKYPECSVYAGVLNHADLNAVVRCFGSLGWHRPGIAQLFLMDQEEFSFQVWMIRHGALRQYAPPEEEDYPFLNLPTQ